MNVLFVVMPLPTARPAIGVSLLKAHLSQMGVSSHIAYLNLRFAERLGEEANWFLSEHLPTRCLAGDWAFAHCLSRGSSVPIDEYLDVVLHRFPADRFTDADLRPFLRAREQAAPFLEECLERVEWSAYDVVGFSTSFAQTVPSLALAERLKDRHPHLQIIFGGANCEAEMGLQLHRSFPFIDYVFTGEADVSFPQFIARLRNGADVSSIPGVVSRRNGESTFVDLAPERVQNLDCLPYPDYGDFFEQYRQTDRKSAPLLLMETSRGCWWGEKQHCTFCGLNGLSMAYRLKSASRAMEELTELSRRYGAKGVVMVDNILDMRYFRDFLPELKRRQLGLHIYLQLKANLSKEQLKLLRDAGFRIIQPGIESLSSHTLRLMRKGESAIQNVQLLKWSKEMELSPSWNLLYGFPGEDPAEYEKMAVLMESLHHLRPPNGCGIIRLDRFSPYFARPAEFGMCNVRPDRIYRYLYELLEDEVRNLAYYFEYDLVDGPNPESYTGCIREAYVRWKDDHDTASLTYFDDGTTVTIEDQRPNAIESTITLRGDDRELYLFCDQNRSLQQVKAFAAQRGRDDEWVAQVLGWLIGLRLMAGVDDRFLSLAIPTERVAAMTRKIARWLEEPPAPLPADCLR